MASFLLHQRQWPATRTTCTVRENRDLQRKRRQRDGCLCVLRWLDECQPDMACLQELKAPDENVSR